MWRPLTALILIAGCGVALAQTSGGGITPTGTITPGDCMKWGPTKFKAADAGAPCFGGASSFANPTAQVGIAAVNGTLLTAMRSDGAPALDQTAAFAFTGLGATNLLTGSTLSWNSDLFLQRDAADTLAQRRTTTPQNFNIYNTFTNSTNYERLAFQATATATLIRQQQAGTGTARSLSIGTDGATQLVLYTNNTDRWSVTSTGNFVPSNSNNALDIGTASGTARDIYIGTSVRLGSAILTGPATGTTQFGAASAASPVAQTVQAQGSRAGTDANVGGASLTVAPGTGTGIGTLATIILQSPVAVASGSGAQTQTTGFIIRNGAASVGSATLTISPGSMGITRITTSGTAPGALGGKIELTCGTTGGTARLIAYAGTSATPVTIVDNIGTGVSGC